MHRARLVYATRMALRWLLIVLLLLTSTASGAPPRPAAANPGPSLYLTVITADACRPERPIPPPTDPALPQPTMVAQAEGDGCLREIESYLNQMRPYAVPRPDDLRRTLRDLGLAEVVVWGPEAAPLFAGRSGITCIVGEVGAGGYRVARVGPNLDGTCGPTPWAAGG